MGSDIQHEKVYEEDQNVQNINYHDFRPFCDSVVNPGWRTQWKDNTQVQEEETVWFTCFPITSKKVLMDPKIEPINDMINYESCDCCFGYCHINDYYGFDKGCDIFCCWCINHCIWGSNEKAAYKSCQICGTGETCATGQEGGCGLSLCGLGCFFGQMIRSLRCCGRLECGYKRYD